MTSARKKLIVMVWVLVSSVTLTYTWNDNPDLFPHIPESFAIWLTNVFSANTAEDVALVGILFGFVVSLILVTCITLSLIFLYKGIARKLYAD